MGADWKTIDWLAIDTEATSPDPLTARIVELGAVRYQNGAILDRRGTLIDPGCAIPVESTAIHHITDEMVAGKPTLETVAPRFLDVVRRAPVLIAYNWPFDAGILARDLGEAWDAAVDGKVIIDPLTVIRSDNVGRYWKNGPDKGRHKLGNVAQRLGAVAERGHRATSDCVTTCRVLEKLLEHLPDDGAEATALVRRWRAEQEAAFAEWQAANPKESAA